MPMRSFGVSPHRDDPKGDGGAPGYSCRATKFAVPEVLMLLKPRPTHLGSGIDKDRRTTPATPASGRSAALGRAASRKSAVVLVPDHQWTDDARCADCQ